jgi:hypothetical protein
MRKSISIENIDNIDKFVGENFSPEQFIGDCLMEKSFAFTHKEQRLKDVKNILKNTDKLYKNSSEKFIDVLLNNYETFISIGKYIDKIDKNISNAMESEKEYSNLIQNLRKDVESFSFNYSKYLKDIKDENEENKENNESNSYKFENVGDMNFLEENFDLNDFLNPKEKGKKWLEEQSENLKVLIDNEKYDESIELVKKIRECDLSLIDYDILIDLDLTYKYLIEKLSRCISRCNTRKEVKIYIDKMKKLNCSSLAVDSFLGWLSEKLKNKIQDKIEKENLENKKNQELNVIKEEDEDFDDIKDDDLNNNNNFNNPQDEEGITLVLYRLLEHLQNK